MIAAPRTAFRPVGSPVWLPTKAPSYRGGSSLVLPATAVLSAAGCRFTTPAAGLFDGASEIPNFSAWGWSRWDNIATEQYTTLMAMEGTGGSYFWLGRDHTAFSGARGLAFYGVAGGHSLTLIPDDGATWFHWACEVVGASLRVWINKTLVTWDTEGSPTTADLAQSTRAGVTTVEFLLEAAYAADQAYIGGARAFGMGTKTGLTQGDINALYASSLPGLGDPDTVGVWELSTKDDLTNSVSGGSALTLAAGTLGTDTTGPAGIVAA